MSNDTKLILGAVAVALVAAWPSIRIAMLRRTPGVIEENGYLFDPRNQTYYSVATSAVVYQQ